MPETAVDRALQDFGSGGGAFGGIKLGQDFRNLSIDEILRSIGSLQAQSFNRIDPNLPMATQLSQQRGIAQGGAEAVQSGITELEKFMAGSNRDALLRMLGFKQQEEIVKLGKPDLLQGLVGGFGQKAGFAAGGGL